MGMLGSVAQSAENARPAGGNPLASLPSHFPAKAKRGIFLFMHGGVSHVDTFDSKPKLTEMDGKPLPFDTPLQFAPTGNLLKSPWKFKTTEKADCLFLNCFQTSDRSLMEFV